MDSAYDEEPSYFQQNIAYDRVVEQELEKLMERHARGAGFLMHRLGIRTLRLAFGGVLAIVGVVIIGMAPSVSDTPFAALTLHDLAGAIFGWGFGILFLYWAVFCAFGAAPTKNEIRERLRVQAENIAATKVIHPRL